jgi:dihydroflavonol-4-reductase
MIASRVDFDQERTIPLPQSSDLVLVTGVSGFVGAAVARALRRHGYSVRGLVRASSVRTNLADFDGELVEGDILDRASIDPAMAGVRFVCHVAADYRLWARDPQDIIRNNVNSTRNMMEAALAARVERIVYTSSVATLKPNPGSPADETRAANPTQAVGAYKRSKVEAERLVEALVDERNLPAVIVNPSTPIGPRDVKPTPTGRIIVEAASGRMPAFVDSGLNLAHVDDVAEGHVLALERGRIGERYILGGQDVSLRDVLATIAGMTGRRAPTISLPLAPLFPFAWANERLAGLLNYEPFLTSDALRMSRHKMYFSSAKAEAELGYTARPHADGLRDALDWFRAEGMVK